MTLPRKLRVSRTTFSVTQKAGKRAESQYFSLTLSIGSGCAAVVSKKVAKRSIDRHLLKRRMLEVLRPYCSDKRAFIAYARAGSPFLPFASLKKELTELLSRV